MYTQRQKYIHRQADKQTHLLSMYDSYRYTTQYHAEYACSANHSVSSSRRQCTRKDRNIHTDKQTNSHICCQCTTVTDTQQYNTTHNTRVQLTIPSAHHTVTAHAKTEVYTTIQYDAEYACSANHSISLSRRYCTRKDRNIYTDKHTNSHICCQCTTVTDTQQYNTTQNTSVFS